MVAVILRQIFWKAGDELRKNERIICSAQDEEQNGFPKFTQVSLVRRIKSLILPLFSAVRPIFCGNQSKIFRDLCLSLAMVVEFDLPILGEDLFYIL